MSVTVPSFTSATVAGIQTENSGTNNPNPTGTPIVANVQTAVATVNVSQQLHDRGGYDGADFDSILQAQILQAVRAQISQQALATAIATAGTVTDGTTATIPLFYAD